MQNRKVCDDKLWIQFTMPNNSLPNFTLLLDKNYWLTECFKSPLRAESGQPSAVVDGNTEAVGRPRQKIVITNRNRRIIGIN